MTMIAERPTRPAPAATARPRRVRSGRNGIHSGQIVATEVAVVALLAGAVLGAATTVAALPVAAILLVVAWTRLRGRWLFQWLRVWLGYRTRRRGLAPGADSAALLGYLRPGAQLTEADLDGAPASIIADAHGLTAVLDLGDPALLPDQAGPPLANPATLLPAPAPDTPRFRVQLVIAAVPAGGPGSVATAYRQLTEGRIPAAERALLAVHAPAAEGWSEPDLRRALSGAVRKIKRRLGTAPVRVLGTEALSRTLAELAHHDGAHPARESWSGLRTGDHTQVTYRLRRWPDPRGDNTGDLVARLLELPATAITVSLAAGPWAPGDTAVRTDLVIRLAAADTGTLARATTALHRLLGTQRATARRLDGEHLDGLATTLPLGGSAPATLPTDAEHGIVRTVAHLEKLQLNRSASGLLVGANRRHEPVTIRLFRPEATRAMLIGGVPAAQLLALRAMALGARVVVQTARPQSWERYLRNLGGPNDTIALATPGQVLAVPAATPLRPLLLVVDVGAVGADRAPGHPWQTTLVLRDELTTADADALGHADLALLQPMSAAAAAIAVNVLGLSDSQREALARPVPGLIGAVHRRSVRWASLGTAPVEQQLLT